MNFQPHNLYHIYNQGNNQQTIFYVEEDYLAFMRLARRDLLPFTEIIAWCLMPNHFHFMTYADERCLKMIKQGGIYIDPITNGIRKLLSSYAKVFNNRYQRTGSIFRQKTKSKNLTDIPVVEKGKPQLKAEEYHSACFHYIHQNPLRAGLVKKMEEWNYSSFKDYAGLRQGTLCNKELATRLGLFNPETFIRDSYDQLPERIVSYLK
ncbi:MAG: transposase [Bacteroidota bacterium]